MPLHRQAEPARTGEVERPGIASDLGNDEGQVTAAQSFLNGEQRIFGAGGGNMNQPVPQIGRQTGLIRPARPAQSGLVLHPQPGPLIGDLSR